MLHTITFSLHKNFIKIFSKNAAVWVSVMCLPRVSFGPFWYWTSTSQYKWYDSVSLTPTWWKGWISLTHFLFPCRQLHNSVPPIQYLSSPIHPTSNKPGGLITFSAVTTCRQPSIAEYYVGSWTLGTLLTVLSVTKRRNSITW